MGAPELRKLYSQRGALRIRPDGVLEIRVVPHTIPRWCAICPVPQRATVVWQTHGLTHAGMAKTVKRLQLTWYWPGMVAETRRLLKTCEVCQSAKTGGLKEPLSRQRLYAGRPWQKVAVDLVGPLPVTPRGNRWILVLTDHFSRWQDAIALPDATAPTVATILDERVFCYLGLPEQIHTDQGTQFESQLMTELCQLWNVDKSRTTPYHPRVNGIVERGNRGLGDALRALLLRQGQEDWDKLLPQILRAFRGTPHATTGETANLLMLGRELRLPDQLTGYPPPKQYHLRHEYVIEAQDRLNQAHEMLRTEQQEIRTEDNEEPPLFAVGDMVWLENRRKKRGDSAKLQSKFVGPYEVLAVFANHTYQIDRLGQQSIQSECRLKLYAPCIEPSGQAPASLEPRRRANMKGATGQPVRRQEGDTDTPPSVCQPIPPMLGGEEQKTPDEMVLTDGEQLAQWAEKYGIT